MQVWNLLFAHTWIRSRSEEKLQKGVKLIIQHNADSWILEHPKQENMLKWDHLKKNLEQNVAKIIFILFIEVGAVNHVQGFSNVC